MIGTGFISIAGRRWRWHVSCAPLASGDLVDLDWAQRSIVLAPALGEQGSAEILAMAIAIISSRVRVPLITSADHENSRTSGLHVDVPEELFGLEVVASLAPLPFVAPAVFTPGPPEIYFTRVVDAADFLAGNLPPHFTEH